MCLVKGFRRRVREKISSHSFTRLLHVISSFENGYPLSLDLTLFAAHRGGETRITVATLSFRHTVPTSSEYTPVSRVWHNYAVFHLSKSAFGHGCPSCKTCATIDSFEGSCCQIKQQLNNFGHIPGNRA